ncbi:MAG: acetyl-CoA carboxylase biotin carboxylase subunit [Caldilineaceae bacterium]|nr:acetyl-CoA carboxylase biotin carboxylase subunit [Caldilineaceae bacterium]MBP8108427.1 acetyl-CoA carboxylase biotin carboxylase subunit [Caldilineaceae bacterium]MBP8124587.1 acetyl-CoA carboxylase biotin carboxylase subunit [Caldilineaceae bacterium]MBP9073343.1 acetyl-CoA carboxylase biotin carboxylase subunit [Caldilineaceae bacterium]
MFRKVLIANRGEIAVRILRACQERGIATVAVYSDPDRTALHVRSADEAYHIGPAPSLESYLRIDKIIDVARRSGADAIHPGYGFLAENAEFAAACADAGITFIGPSPEAIEKMGDKITARQTVAKRGVRLVPGSEPGLGDEELRAIADQIGYPVMIKASAGGGGKGMRAVNSPAEFQNALEAARREAGKAFGNDEVYLEKMIVNARHIEFQILADSFGNTIHLGERECSIQRRHQKLIEESPSVAIDAKLRDEMGKMAVAAAEAVNYVNAGTIECLFDSRDNSYYFLEMNTRLQVEHPVTEFVTGVDIVKEQISIAAGRRMRYRQEDIVAKGWSIECRITAEDPFNNFMPNSGLITFLQEPTGPGVRVESGLYRGYEVSLFYDPMIAKLVVWGETRAEAILRMRRALAEYRIGGIKTSIPFHQSIMDSTEFIWGTFDTGFLNRRQFVKEPAGKDGNDRIAAVAAALIAHEENRKAVHIGTSTDATVQENPWKQAGRIQATGGRW